MGDRLVIPLRTAECFDVLDMLVGNCSQIARHGPLPAEMFAGEGVRMWFDLVQPGQDVTLLVENSTSDSQTFDAMLVGTRKASAPIRPLGFRKDVDSSSATVPVTSCPNIDIWPSRLFIPRRVHDNFIVHDVMVGGIQQRVSRTLEDESGIWAELLLPCAVSSGEAVTFLVENTSNQTQRFRAAIVGAARA